MNIKKKRKGVILLEALFAMILFGMISYGFAATSTLQFQQLSAVKVATQAQQYAEVEAKYIQGIGYTDIETTGIHGLTSMESLIGETGWKSETKIAATKDLPESTEDDPKKVKVVSIDVYKDGETMPRFSLSVPLLSSQGDSAIRGTVDYTKKISVDFPFVAPADGILYITISYSNVTGCNGGDFYINGTYLCSDYSNADWNNSKDTKTVIVSKNDTITFNGGYSGNNSYFVPFK